MYSVLNEHSALNDAFLLMRQSLVWSVMRIVHDPQTAEDLAQETYLRARRAIEQEPIDHLEAFLHRTARNLAIDHQRRKALTGAIVRSDVSEADSFNVPGNTPSPEESLIQRERLALLYAALGNLPSRARTVWILNRIEKWTHARIAAHLGVSPNTVYNDLKMAMGHCHDALKRTERL